MRSPDVCSRPGRTDNDPDELGLDGDGETLVERHDGAFQRPHIGLRGDVSGADFHRLGRTSETMIRLARDGDSDAAIAIWDGLPQNEQRMIWFSLVAMVNHLRAERGDDPDATYGPPETTGL